MSVMDSETKITNVRSLLITITLVVLIVTAGTFAWLNYRSKSTAMVLTIGDTNDIQITLKPYQLDLELSPVLTYTSLDANQEYVTVTVTNNSSSQQYYSLFYEISHIDSSLQSSDFKYTVLKSTDNWSTSTVDVTGNFASASTTDWLYIIDEVSIPANTTWYYRVYTWVDGGNNPNIENATFKATLQASLLGSKPLPVLTSGLIPVTIANDGTVTAVSKMDNNWFDYTQKQWANAVLTTSTNRSTYQTIANGVGSSTTIPSSEILAYYVWIPRYSYKIWTLDASQAHTGDEQSIDIKFVKKSTKESGSVVGSYYTHPAFTFGNKELSGFWVGKFETSTDTSSTCYTSPSVGTCNTAWQSPRIVPNADSLRYQTVSNEFATSLKFAGGTQSGSTVTFAGNSTYGLSSSADTHMMKNSEWGAVAYLSHSIYGINNEIRINNYRKDTTTYATLTGCGASTANASVSATCDITYGGSSSYPQSTTGNIGGIFDISGGAWESVMGFFQYEDYASSSGFTTFPESKYYNAYPSSVFAGSTTTNMTFCTLPTCGGQALYETRKWYSDADPFAYSTVPWFKRGGNYLATSQAGAFNSGCDFGGGVLNTTWRSVLITG